MKVGFISVAGLAQSVEARPDCRAGGRRFDSRGRTINQGLKMTEKLRACLHGGGGPQVGEVTRFGGVTRLSI